MAERVEDGIDESMPYCDFPNEYGTHVCITNVIEWLGREIRRCAHVAISFPDGNPPLILIGAQLRYADGTQWGNNLNMKHLKAVLSFPMADGLHSCRGEQKTVALPRTWYDCQNAL